MAIAVRGVGSATGSSSATAGASNSNQPNLPTGSAAGDRVYVWTVSTGSVTPPAGWTTVLASTALGGGASADTTGTRQGSLFYRDYDAVWTMSAFTNAAVAGVAPGIEVAPIAFSKAAGETFDNPNLGSGSDTTSGTGYSVTTGSFADPTGGIVWLMWAWPLSPGTLSALSLTATGATFGGNTSRHGVVGQATGQDVFLATWTYPVTVGATAAHTAAVTGTVAGTAGAVVLSQTVSLAPPPQRAAVLVSNPAALRAATR